MIKFLPMDSWAVIKTGGKQYLVSQGDQIAVEKISKQPDDSVLFNEVLMVCENGKVTLGKPLLPKAKVKAKLLETFRDKKIRVIKFKPKSKYLRTKGHRQQKTKILIEKIES